mgnify:CR=1 FL=1
MRDPSSTSKELIMLTPNGYQVLRYIHNQPFVSVKIVKEAMTLLGKVKEELIDEIMMSLLVNELIEDCPDIPSREPFYTSTEKALPALKEWRQSPLSSM